MTSPRKASAGRWLRNLVLLGVSGLLTLVAAELVLRVVPGPHTPSVWPIVTQHDPLLGWSLIPDTSGTISTGEFETTELINSWGHRGPDLPREKQPDEIRVLLLGDSFTEGYTVEQDETVAAVLEETLAERSERWGGGPIHVMNSGTRGWSTDQQLLYFVENAEALQPDLTVLMFFMNDVIHNTAERIWRGFKPRYVLDGEGLALTGVPVPAPEPRAAEVRLSWKRRVRDAVQSLALYRLGQRAILELGSRPTPDRIPEPYLPWSKSLDEHPRLAEGWAVTELLLARLRDESEAAGSDLLVFWVPSREAIYEEDWERMRTMFSLDPEQWSSAADAARLGTICRSHQLTCVIPLEEFRGAARSSEARLYLSNDGHWTAAGHAVAGRLLAAEVGERLGTHASESDSSGPANGGA